MRVKIVNINADAKRVEYDIYKDDGTTLISSGESAEYSEAIPNVDPNTSFSDFAAVMVADATDKKESIALKLGASKSANASQITALTDTNAEIDSRLSDLETDVVAIA